MTDRRVPTKRDLQTRLSEAQTALAASYEATRTHGHQAITWRCLRADAARVQQIEGWLANGNYGGQP